MTAHRATFHWQMAPAPTAPAPATFPYRDHATVEQTDTSDPAAWYLANRARFDRIYANHPDRAAGAIRPNNREDRLAAARAWHLAMKPYFDAIYGP